MQIFRPGSDGYTDGTSPHNSIVQQHPDYVVRVETADDVVEAVRDAAAQGKVIRPQATGHGAGAEVGPDQVVLDTSGLDDVEIDVEARVVRVGAGATWGAVNAAAQDHGLLGYAGSSPTVSVSGYTFGGGIGWMSRPGGMASAHLRRVEYVDGAGRQRIASDDAADELDRDALFVFRGGGGVGVATVLELDLVVPDDLHAGLLLWPAEHLDAVVRAWAGAIVRVGPATTTSIAVLQAAPPVPLVPEELQGRPVVHLALADHAGGDGAQVLLDAVRAAAPPAADTWGPADVERLGGIHLDPPPGVAAVGDARWLTVGGEEVVADVLRVALEDGSPLALVEVRSTSPDPGTRAGAFTTAPGPFLWHAVGSPTDDTSRTRLEAAFADVRSAAAPRDAGEDEGSWMEGAASTPGALAPAVRERARAIADRVDPDGVVARPRQLV